MKQEEKELCRWFFDLVGYFNHYSFFTKKQWKKVKRFEKEDEAEIKCLFMHYWFHHQFGYYTCPCGCTWFSEVGEESYNNYIEKFQPVINAFEEWKIQQR